MNALLDPAVMALSEENADLRRQIQLATNALERSSATTASLRERLRICREALEKLQALANERAADECPHVGDDCCHCGYIDPGDVGAIVALALALAESK